MDMVRYRAHEYAHGTYHRANNIASHLFHSKTADHDATMSILVLNRNILQPYSTSSTCLLALTRLFLPVLPSHVTPIRPCDMARSAPAGAEREKIVISK